jgi:hypothetical protein
MVIDLRAVFGKTYLVKMDESYAVEKRDLRNADEPWFQEVQGKYGTVYPYSDAEIAVAFDVGIHKVEASETGEESASPNPEREINKTRGGLKKRDAFLSDIGHKANILQNAYDRIVYRVPNSLAGKAIKAIKGRRTRQLSEEEKIRRRENLEKGRLAHIKQGGKGQNESQSPALPPQTPPPEVFSFVL